MGRPKHEKNDIPFHPDAVRKKIRATLLVRRLQDHIFNGLELSLSQVRAIDILLKKVVPDLTRTLISAEINVRYVAHLPEPISREAWLKKYSGDYLDPDPPRIVDGTNGSGP